VRAVPQRQQDSSSRISRRARNAATGRGGGVFSLDQATSHAASTALFVSRHAAREPDAVVSGGIIVLRSAWPVRLCRDRDRQD
jgi:hypothetical protein